MELVKSVAQQPWLISGSHGQHTCDTYGRVMTASKKGRGLLRLYDCITDGSVARPSPQFSTRAAWPVPSMKKSTLLLIG